MACYAFISTPKQLGRDRPTHSPGRIPLIILGAAISSNSAPTVHLTRSSDAAQAPTLMRREWTGGARIRTYAASTSLVPPLLSPLRAPRTPSAPVATGPFSLGSLVRRIGSSSQHLMRALRSSTKCLFVGPRFSPIKSPNWSYNCPLTSAWRSNSFMTLPSMTTRATLAPPLLRLTFSSRTSKAERGTARSFRIWAKSPGVFALLLDNERLKGTLAVPLKTFYSPARGCQSDAFSPSTPTSIIVQVWWQDDAPGPGRRSSRVG